MPGAIPRAGTVADGTTVCDFDEAERSHQRSVSLAVAPLVHGDTKVNLVDTPGYADFVGELRAGLRAADCALFVVAANEGVDEATRRCGASAPRCRCRARSWSTKLDHARADYDGVLAQAQAAFGDKVLPLYLPTATTAEVTALRGCLAGDLDERTARPLIEGIIEESEDESLMDRYLGGEEITEDVLSPTSRRRSRAPPFFPVIPVCSPPASAAPSCST